MNADGTLVLDERPPLPPGPVRVSVESVGPPTSARADGRDLSEADIRQRKARMDLAIGCLSDGQAATMMGVIEDEFERVDPDEWG